MMAKNLSLVILLTLSESMTFTHCRLCYSNISKIDFKCNCSLLVLISFHEPCHSFCMQTIVMSFQIDLKRLFNFSFHYYKQNTLTRLRKNRKKARKTGFVLLKYLVNIYLTTLNTVYVLHSEEVP